MNVQEIGSLIHQAQIAGLEYPPPGVEDTPVNREIWDHIADRRGVLQEYVAAGGTEAEKL